MSDTFDLSAIADPLTRHSIHANAERAADRRASDENSYWEIYNAALAERIAEWQKENK